MVLVPFQIFFPASMFHRKILTTSFEYTCDRYALELGHDMEPPLIQMHVNTIYNLVVDKHYSRYYNSHPSLMERLEIIEKWKIENDWKPPLRKKQSPPTPDSPTTFDDQNLNQYLIRSYHLKTQ
jgi:hypothetical protein